MANIETNALYMATNGKDSNTGTIDSPLATIGGAISKGLGSGKHILYIRSGEYFPTDQVKLNPQGTSDHPIIIQRYPSDTGSAKFNLKKFPVSTAINSAFIFSTKGKYITIEGLEIYNNTGSTSASAILCEGIFNNIIVKDCYIHDLGGSEKGIGVSFAAINGVEATGCKVLGCKFENMKNGMGETVRSTGLSKGVEVANCTFNNISNISVVIAGNYYNYGQSTNAYIHDNSFNNSGVGNSSDPPAVYIDGGARVTVENNTFNHCQVAYGVTCENTKGSNVVRNVFRNNIIKDSIKYAILVGSWSSTPVLVSDNTIKDNTINHSSENAVINLYKAVGVTFEANHITTTNSLVIAGQSAANPFAKSSITFTNNKIYKEGATSSSNLFKEINGTVSSMTLSQFEGVISIGTGNSINPKEETANNDDEENIFITLANLRVFKEKLLEEINRSK